MEAAVYFCCLEALQNAGKHAGEGASCHGKGVGGTRGTHFEVADDGAGFDASGTKGKGAGFVNMGDRVGAMGGSVSLAGPLRASWRQAPVVSGAECLI